MSKLAVASALGLLAVHLWLGLRFIDSAAPTFDEPVHLASGYSYLRTGLYRLNIRDHPPFAEMWAAMPLLLDPPHLFSQHPDFRGGRPYHYSDFFLYRNRLSAESMLNAARRFAFFTWTLALAATLLFWARAAGGAAALVAAAWGYAFSPALLSNLALVTTDGASAACWFVSAYLASEAARRESRWLWSAAGVFTGLAMASKFNIFVLPPTLLALVFCSRRMEGRSGLPWGLGWLLGAAALSLAAIYRLDQLPLYWEGLRDTIERLEQGRSSFFFGRRSTVGTWLYFPVALAVKTPAASLALAALGALRIFRMEPARALWVWAPGTLYLGLALFSKVQIGYRHVLPVLPFVLLAAALGAAYLWEKGRWARAFCCCLLAWQAFSVWRVHPHYLAYFNEWVGGPSRGYRCLVDSNLDWGQALKGLAREIQSRGNPPVFLSYFGTADPEFYGIRYIPVGFYSLVERPGNAEGSPPGKATLLAVSATNLQGVYYQDPHVFDWLRERVPDSVVGYSIFLYDLNADPEGRRRLAELLPSGTARRLLIE